jgi:hypothetical protein
MRRMENSSDRAIVLPSLNRVRAELAAPARRPTPMWLLLLVAMLAAVSGVAVAGVMILGPGGGTPSIHSLRL